MVSTFAGVPLRCVTLLIAVPLAACSSLPVIAPDAALMQTPVQMEAANGRILSPGQSQALLDKRGLSGAQSNHFERHLALEQEISGSPLIAGNAAVLLQDGPVTYAAMFAAIEGARDSSIRSICPHTGSSSRYRACSKPLAPVPAHRTMPSY